MRVAKSIWDQEPRKSVDDATLRHTMALVAAHKRSLGPQMRMESITRTDANKETVDRSVNTYE